MSAFDLKRTCASIVVAYHHQILPDDNLTLEIFAAGARQVSSVMLSIAGVRCDSTRVLTPAALAAPSDAPRCPLLTESGHESHQSTDRECAGAMASQAHLLIAGVMVCPFRLRFYQSRQAPFKSRRPRVGTCCACWPLLPTPRLSAAPDVASDCSCRRRPNTPTRATCVTAGNADRAVVPLRLPFPLAPSEDGVGPTSNDL